MDKIIRCITSDGAVMVSAIDSTDIVYTAKEIHRTSNVATAAFGRLLTAASMMGAQLKQESATLSLRIAGDGPMGVVFASSDSAGNVRGYVGNAACPTTHYPNGKLNVSEAVGKNGVLSVVRDFGNGQPYTGQVPLVSGEIAEDIASYFAVSEQLPTVCVLGVLVDKSDGSLLLSGGLLAQLLPGADDSTIDALEANVKKLEPVTTMLAKGMSPLDMCQELLSGFEVEVLDEMPVKYRCRCCRESLENAIMGFSDEEILALAADGKSAQAKCYFCNRTYEFTLSDLDGLIAEKKKKS